MTRALMVMGTGSDVGKSVVAAGLCRIFHRVGIDVAPFKAQNMSLNSFVTSDGGEMGRAQVLQAEACGLPPHVDMNPILLKPEADNCSQVVVHGKVWGKYDGRNYFARRDKLFRFVQESYEHLARDHALIVIEGARQGYRELAGCRAGGRTGIAGCRHRPRRRFCPGDRYAGSAFFE